MLDIVRGRHSTDLTNSMKQDFWKKLTEEVNALGVACRSEEEVRNRWRNMSRSAKEKFTNHRLERQKTGGGPPPAALSVAEERIVDAMQDTAAFIGVPGGQETAVSQLDAGNSSSQQLASVERVWDIAIRRIAERPPEQLFADDVEDVAATPAERAPVEPVPTATASTSSTVGQKRSCEEGGRPSSNPRKKRKTAEDVYEVQCRYFEQEMKKSALQIKLLEKLLSNFDDQQDTVSLLAALSH